MILVAFAFNAAFALLAARFDYPDILREPTAAVLANSAPGGASLVLLWWAFALIAVLMVPLVVLLSSAITDAEPTLIAIATTVGVIAAVVQFLGSSAGHSSSPTSPGRRRPRREPGPARGGRHRGPVLQPLSRRRCP
jgi:hypothetical protein